MGGLGWWNGEASTSWYDDDSPSPQQPIISCATLISIQRNMPRGLIWIFTRQKTTRTSLSSLLVYLPNAGIMVDASRRVGEKGRESEKSSSQVEERRKKENVQAWKRDHDYWIQFQYSLIFLSRRISDRIINLRSISILSGLGIKKKKLENFGEVG